MNTPLEKIEFNNTGRWISQYITFPKVVMDFTNMSHEEWEEARNNHYGLDHYTLGGSDAGVIMQVNKYKDLPQLYHEKLGKVHIPVGNAATEWGHLLEPIIREKFQQENPEYYVYEWKALLQHPEIPHMVANIDGLYFDTIKQEWGLLEIKNISSNSKRDWADGVPEYYYCQFQHYLKVLDLQFGYFAVKFDSFDYQQFYVVRDDNYINNLVFQEEMFIQRLHDRDAPELTGTKSSDVLITHLYPEGGHEYEKEKRGGGVKVEKEVMELDDEIGKLVAERQEVRAEREELEKREKQLDNKIKAHMQDYQKAVYEKEDRKLSVSWSNSSGKKYLNVKKLQEEQPDLYEKFCKAFDVQAFKEHNYELAKNYMEEGQGTRTFRITESKPKGAKNNG